MSLSGLFMLFFLGLHLVLNLQLILDDSGESFNMVAHFMATNPLIKVMEPVLALGFIIHIIYAFVLSLHNMKARPVKYASLSQGNSSTWASRNMIYLGIFILGFLVLHIANFWWKMKITHTLDEVVINGEHMENAYLLVSTMFTSNIWVSVVYFISFVFLGLHLMHGFWSAFQTIGWSNDLWRKRLEVIGKIYAILIVLGYAAIPVYFLLGLHN